MPRDWDAAAYDRLPIPMTGWGARLVERMRLRGDETVLDAGCGTGRVTELLLRRLPRGRVIALDGSASMIEAARERLGDRRVTYLVADLLEPIPVPAPVDAVLSRRRSIGSPTTIACSATSRRRCGRAAGWRPSAGGPATSPRSSRS